MFSTRPQYSSIGSSRAFILQSSNGAMHGVRDFAICLHFPRPPPSPLGHLAPRLQHPRPGFQSRCCTTHTHCIDVIHHITDNALFASFSKTRRRTVLAGSRARGMGLGFAPGRRGGWGRCIVSVNWGRRWFIGVSGYFAGRRVMFRSWRVTTPGIPGIGALQLQSTFSAKSGISPEGCASFFFRSRVGKFRGKR